MPSRKIGLLRRQRSERSARPEQEQPPHGHHPRREDRHRDRLDWSRRIPNSCSAWPLPTITSSKSPESTRANVFTGEGLDDASAGPSVVIECS